MLEEIAPNSYLSWLDFSEHERRKALDVIDLFRGRGTVDELGLGTIRDALADLLFPGTSTLQTRARYFLFIPWLYRDLEARGIAPAEIEKRARRSELRLIQSLIDGGEKDGVIGIDARETLRRLPSSIYWQGLRSWGIRRLDVSIADYHREFGRFGRVRASSEDDEMETEGHRDLWHANLPKAPHEFLDSTNFALTRAEATYLAERLMCRDEPSLLAWLTDEGRPSQVGYPWLHPQLASVPQEFLDQVEHARLFSLLGQGAALAYNFYLAELTRNQELEEEYRSRIVEWATEVEANRASLQSWQWGDFRLMVARQNPRIGVNTWAFIEHWRAKVLSSPAGLDLVMEQDVRKSIEHRERSLKRNLARLTNELIREKWSGESGTGRMDFRWFRAQIIVNDILVGLGRA